MNGKSVIFMIIVSAISLVITVAAYYGYTRYLTLKFDNNTVKYANEYLKLSRGGVKSKIIVSLYSSDETYSPSLKTTINSLLDQTFRPDQIIINVPPTSSLKLDEVLTKNEIVVVYKMSKDYGDIGNLISPLLREKDANTLLILANENVVYGLEFIEKMIATSVENPDCIIYNRGYNAKQFTSNNSISDNEKTNDIIDADYGVLVKPKFFDATILTEDRFKSLTVLLSVYNNNNKICVKKMHYSELFSNNKRNPENILKEILINSVYLPSFI